MAEVCVITGGGSGMGFEAARCMPKEKIIVVSGRTVAKLEKAIAALKEEGHEAYAFACDTSKVESVAALADYALSLGEIKNVINAAGISPAMGGAGDQEKILRINALGTVNVNREFAKRMKAGSVIVDVSSNSAYSLPDFLIAIARKSYKYAESEESKFLEKLIKLSNMAKTDYEKNGFAYALSKNFVCWYAQQTAFRYGKQGIRIVSLSPGLIATDMGNLEAGSGGYLIDYACEKRMGKPEELGFALATLADERNGYLAGVDVLCDGGSTAGLKLFKNRKKK